MIILLPFVQCYHRGAAKLPLPSPPPSSESAGVRPELELGCQGPALESVSSDATLSIYRI